MRRGAATAGAVAVAALLAGCGSGSASPAGVGERGTVGTDASSGESVPASGRPVVASGPSGTLLVTSVDENPEGSGARNGVLLQGPDGGRIPVQPLPTDVPLEQVSLVSVGGSFLLHGLECHPASTEDVASEYGCAPRDPVSVAFVLHADGRWHDVAAPPTEAMAGLLPIAGLDSVQFVTGSGALLHHDGASDEWSTQGTGVVQVEGACRAGDSWAVVGRVDDVGPDAQSSFRDWPDLAVATGSGVRVELPGTGAASGKVVCDGAGERVAWVSWLSPSFIIDLRSGAVTELPPLPVGSQIGEGAVIRRDRLSVPISSSGPADTSPGAAVDSTSRLASIAIAGGADWNVAAWPYDSLPDVKATATTDDSVVAVVADRDEASIEGSIIGYRLATWNL